MKSICELLDANEPNWGKFESALHEARKLNLINWVCKSQANFNILNHNGTTVKRYKRKNRDVYEIYQLKWPGRNFNIKRGYRIEAGCRIAITKLRMPIYKDWELELYNSPYKPACDILA